jgi:hypothetical protein
VQYVGDAQCGAGCHDAKVHSYHNHPMGRSVFAVPGGDGPPTDRAHNNPFRALDSQFRVERTRDTVRHHRSALNQAGRAVYDFSQDVAYAIGSGARGHSYLALRDGYVFQTAISWYEQKQVWDLSPGFNAALAPGRPVQAECLFCHANRAEPEPGYVNRYKVPVFDGLAIGCERCHGPGELHVAIRRKAEPVPGDVDPTIVNPAHLDPALREAVCQQCHLTGEVRVVRRGRGLYDYRPGLPLQDFLTAFVRAGNEGRNKATNHVEQMYLSRCFQKSQGDGQLGCVSCHDPHVHVGPGERVAHYRASCLACHREHGCSLPREARLKESPQDSCSDCHMPRRFTADIPHTASTDHRIVRRKDAGPAPASGGPPPSSLEVPVEPFPGRLVGRADRELGRDLGIALAQLGELGRIHSQAYTTLSLELLDRATARDPEDWDAWEARAVALKAQGQRRQALAALQDVLARQPHRELALARAGVLAQAVGEHDLAADYWRRATEANPWMASYRRDLATVLAQKGAWDQVGPVCRAWLDLDPSSVQGRVLLVTSLLHAGKKPEARAEFEKVRALRPPHLAQLEAWFNQESK